jgi:hypothetical protein
VNLIRKAPSLRSIAQMALMAAIVATLLVPPVALALGLALRLFDIRLSLVATFGGALNVYVGLLVWWLSAFALALVYAAFAFPWHAD